MALSNKPPLFSFPETEIPGWLFFCILVAFASVRARAASADSDADDALSDFTNDLFTDLGPLLALFGEQMTKQYISESTTCYDYFIFGMGPIGVITTIVSTIRLCGPASLRAFIGRSKEGNSAVEAELCTSTSRDVCEVFNNGGITRVLGQPKILELIRTPKNYLRHAPHDREMNRKAGLYLFRDYVEDASSSPRPTRHPDPEWKLPVRSYYEYQLNPPLPNPPNLSLNVGITQYDPWIFFLVALVGLILQAGVIVVAGIGVWVLGWNLDQSTAASTNYAPTIFIVGTVLMCGGMCACIAIIGQATTEVRCRRAASHSDSPATSLIWLQPRQQLLFWTSSIKTWDLYPEREFKFKSATCIAAFAVLVGYVLQFIGLRGMRAWVSIAQLITTVVMSILRGMLRMQRLKKEDNQLLRKAALIQGHELDWLALEISRRDSLKMQSTRVESNTTPELTQAKPFYLPAMASPARNQPSYQNLMNLRICLTEMTGNDSQHVKETGLRRSTIPWGADVSKVRDKAKELAAAVEQVASIFCKGKRAISLNLPGSQLCRPEGITNEGSPDEKSFNAYLKPQENQAPSNWRVDYMEIEAILGLTLWSLISDRRFLDRSESAQLEYTRAGNVSNWRIISAGPEPRNVNGELELACWGELLKTRDLNDYHRSGMPETLPLPLDEDLDSYSLGSIWWIRRNPPTSCAPLKELKEKHRVFKPGHTPLFPEVEELRDPISTLMRLCGWSGVLRAHQNMQLSKHSYSARILGCPKESSNTIWVQLSRTSSYVSSLLDICTQELFGAFLAQLQMQGDHHDNCGTVYTRFDLKCLREKVETIKAISQIFVGSGLGSNVDAISCILPALLNRQIGDRSQAISIVSSTCDSLLERSKSTEALTIAEIAIEALHDPETMEEERSLARALCVVSKIQRFEMRNDRGLRKRRHCIDFCWELCEQATRRQEQGHLRLATIKELHRLHISVWELYGDNRGESAVVYETLLAALKKRDRFETLRSLCVLTKDVSKSSSAQTRHSISAALPLAAKEGWFEAVDAMLSLGFDPLAQDEAGRTALSYCAEYGQFEHEVCVEIILGHEKAFNALKSVSWPADDGRTPLLWAIDQCHDEMVRILLKNGCSVNEQGARELSPLGDLSPLGEAISKNLEGIVRQLIDAGAELRPEHIDAAKYGNSQGIKQLIFGYLRLLVHECPDRWVQHLPDVIEHGDVSTVEMLLQRGVSCSFEHIVLAVRKGQPEVQNLFFELLRRSVEDYPTHTKEWLSKLAEEDDNDTLQALLDNGASVLWNGAQA